MHRIHHVLALTFGVAAGLLAASIADADPVTASAGVTINALTGKHDTGTSVERLTLLPAPIGEIEVRNSRYALRLEGLPPVRGGVHDETTTLSLLNATARAFAPGGVFYAGVAETLYNQQTVGGPNANVQPNQTHASRVTGFRIEGGAVVPLRRNDRLELNLAVNPKMHGIVYTTYTYNDATYANAESATQLDVSARRVLQRGRVEFIYGVRYINYSARYEMAGAPYDGGLSDRNVGVLPLAGIRYRL